LAILVGFVEEGHLYVPILLDMVSIGVISPITNNYQFTLFNFVLISDYYTKAGGCICGTGRGKLGGVPQCVNTNFHQEF